MVNEIVMYETEDGLIFKNREDAQNQSDVIDLKREVYNMIEDEDKKKMLSMIFK